MLNSLDALAGKISPGSGKNSPSQQQSQTNLAAQSQQQQQQQQQQKQQQQQQTQPSQQNSQQQQPQPIQQQQQQLLPQPQQQQQSQQQQQPQLLQSSVRLNGSNQCLNLDSNCNKLYHVNHNNTTVHPYQKHQLHQNSSSTLSAQQQQHLQQLYLREYQQSNSSSNNNNNTNTNNNTNNGNNNTNSSTNNNNNSSELQQQMALQEQELQQQQHELFLQQQQQKLQLQLRLQQQQQQLLLDHEQQLQQQELQQQEQQQQMQMQQQQQQQQEAKSLSSSTPYTPLSVLPATLSPSSPQKNDTQQIPSLPPTSQLDENDCEQEFRNCLKDNAFGMSDKSSTTNSLPNSPIHTNNNNIQLLNNNNNNTCSANRNVLDDDDTCYRLGTETTYGDKEPDPDNIKMFVGQVPKSMDEAQLREMFEEYGPVHSINVLRDKATGISKGCCFVTFYTRRAALKAQDALHNVKTLSGMYHPIQMKPADSENRNERKLFVGMLNKKLNENDVRKLFEVHGAIEECTVLRDQNGQSKGCAFVTFATKHAAISAIKTLNQNKTMEGCTSPLVVKFADTQKEKEQKKIQQIQANLWNLATNINIPLGQTATTVSTPILPNPPQQASPVLGADAASASLQLLQQLQAVGLQQQLLQGLGAQTNTADSAAAAAAAAGLLPPMTVQNLAAIAAMTQPSLTNAANNPGTAQLQNTAALLWSDPNPLASAYMSTAAGLPQFGTTTLSASPLASVALSTAAAAAAGKQIEGPEGCNLFIYHLPQEFTDTDLASTFLPFGNVISAKVFIDKQTNLSKCFGFVSFDNQESAQVAIKAMNGFQVGTKRLKVQLKKPKDASKPY